MQFEKKSFFLSKWEQIILLIILSETFCSQKARCMLPLRKKRLIKLKKDIVPTVFQDNF